MLEETRCDVNISRIVSPVQFPAMKWLARVSTIFRVACVRSVSDCVVVGCILLGAAVWVAAEPIASLPRPSNYVSDFAGVLDEATQARLNALCLEVDQKAHAQIAVVTVKSVDGQDVVSYAVALYQKFGIGAKGKDRGVLILLATDDHKYWISVGYGLEAILPDGKVGGFGREAVPILRTGNYGAAATLLTTRVAAVITEDAGVTLDNQPRITAPRRQPAPGLGLVWLVFIIIFIVISILRAIFRGGGGGRGGGSGFWSGLLWGLLFSNIGGGRGGDGGGFGGFGGGGGGGGFGGFGGGSTGGGGAGGSW